MANIVRTVGLDELIINLDAATSRMANEVDKVMAKAGVNIKNGVRQRWSGHPHIKHLPNAVSYDLYHWPTHTILEIGPDKNRRQGPLGNIIEFGTVNNAPIPALSPELDAELPRTMDALAALTAKVLDGLP